MPKPYYRKLLLETAKKMKTYSVNIRKAIYDFGVLKTLENKPVFAYEIDGKGNFSFYDDSNLPSLISLPYL